METIKSCFITAAFSFLSAFLLQRLLGGGYWPKAKADAITAQLNMLKIIEDGRQTKNEGVSLDSENLDFLKRGIEQQVISLGVVNSLTNRAVNFGVAVAGVACIIACALTTLLGPLHETGVVDALVFSTALAAVVVSLVETAFLGIKWVRDHNSSSPHSK